MLLCVGLDVTLTQNYRKYMLNIRILLLNILILVVKLIDGRILAEIISANKRYIITSIYILYIYFVSVLLSLLNALINFYFQLNFYHCFILFYVLNCKVIINM